MESWKGLLVGLVPFFWRGSSCLVVHFADGVNHSQLDIDTAKDIYVYTTYGTDICHPGPRAQERQR